MFLKVFALVAIVMVVGIGFIATQGGQVVSLLKTSSTTDSTSSMPLNDYGGFYYPSYNSHAGDKGFLMGVIGSFVFFGSALLAWNTMGPGKRKDAKPVEKDINFSRMIVHSILAAIGFSMIAGAVVGLSADWYSSLLDSDFIRVFLILGFLFPLGLFVYLGSMFSAMESALSSMLQFGFTLVLFPASFLLFLLISELLWPSAYYLM